MRRLVSLLRAVDTPPSPTIPILVLDGATDFFSKLEGSAPPDEVRVLWERVLAAADNGQISLIATDTKARYDLSGLPGRIVRLPDQRSLLNAHLAPYLPTVLPDSDGLPVSRPGDSPFQQPQRTHGGLSQGVVLVGALSTFVPFDEEHWQAAMRERIPAKLLDVNLRAFALGRAAVR